MSEEQVPQAVLSAISAAVCAGIEAGRALTLQAAKDAYSATERRLCALPVLRVKTQADAEQHARIRSDGSPEHQAQLCRLQSVGGKLSPGEMLDILIRELDTALLIDQQEIETMERALEVISEDPYYLAISGKYLDELRLTDKDVAARLFCDVSTVRRNRGRLIRRLAIRLYGVPAIE